MTQVDIALIGLDKRGLRIANSDEDVVIDERFIRFDELIARIGVLGPKLTQAFVAFAWHEHIDVIIPGNKAAGTNSANAAAAAKIKRQVMLLTEGFKVFRHLKALGLEPLEVFLSQFLHCYSPSSAENAVSKGGIFLNAPAISPTSVPTPYET